MDADSDIFTLLDKLSKPRIKSYDMSFEPNMPT